MALNRVPRRSSKTLIIGPVTPWARVYKTRNELNRLQGAHSICDENAKHGRENAGVQIEIMRKLHADTARGHE